MSDVSVDRESPDVEIPPEKYEEMESHDVPYGEEKTTLILFLNHIDIFINFHCDSYGIFKFWTGFSNKVTVAIIMKMRKA